MFASKPNHQSSIPGTHMVEATDSDMSSDFYICAVACSHPQINTYMYFFKKAVLRWALWERSVISASRETEAGGEFKASLTT